jgi:FkbM family methyltransferase
MRRLKILFYWLSKTRNNVDFFELLNFLSKPGVKRIAAKFIRDISETDGCYKVSFVPIEQTLYWPRECGIEGISQVASETFDHKDWHYYQKEHTEVEPNETILDVGAAEGLFALSVIDKCKQIILIEPNDYFVRALGLTFQSYRDKVTIHPIAVGNMVGEITFDQDSLSGKVDGKAASGPLKKITTIDKLLGDAQITYLKADLEGYELEMLKGAKITIQRNRPKIAITSYHTENDAMEIIREIKSYVPEYQHYVKGIYQAKGKPVMIHFWVDR